MSKPTVGYIGLGNAGYPMAACLAKKGYRLVVYDAAMTPATTFVEEFPQCTTLAAVSGAVDTSAFSECSVVITMLPNGKIVRDVLLGENGIASSLKPGDYRTIQVLRGFSSLTTLQLDSVVVDTSSSSPFDTRSLGEDLARISIDLVDSPITQKELHAINRGGATLMVGSDSPAALQRVLPVLVSSISCHNANSPARASNTRT